MAAVFVHLCRRVALGCASDADVTLDPETSLRSETTLESQCHIGRPPAVKRRASRDGDDFLLVAVHNRRSTDTSSRRYAIFFVHSTCSSRG